ncbi:DUF4231 domain-containing protein [Mesorhizobium qingshengii]|uniref:DUF4231 domain-containing protein n=1 Tax=Mesorhizobium qingshengii TaxID=1165689 RepID=A0ABT4R2Y4_9HYPH|nr:hypothetical protein [Mesorhizobium qingshengii]MCZ8548193.1 DUF4231 domain-containing protein [Mesorhizobium qingshengii]
MSNTQSPPISQASLGRDVLHAIRYYLGGRRGLIVAGASVAVAGVAFNWGWLVAAGIAPLLLAMLPCAAMCALGLCMNRTTAGHSSTDVDSKTPDRERSDEPDGDKSSTHPHTGMQLKTRLPADGAYDIREPPSLYHRS